ncbi:putative disease resistance protein At4g19050 [Eucalyptus grandis]|uniref:putative disease resistance protein At4g19050 n=1 Tax=Eucalyptus grandis TaxID=71139 RepID=UPI00192E82FD|nr:putative disease resistance protein At4g19050 [Eucalyptus grandis]
MANSTDSLETRKQEVLASLSDDNVKTVVLSGEAGVLITWMAKEISDSASLMGSCYGTIWVDPGYNFEGKSLVEYIAIRLSAFPSNEVGEEDDNAEMEQQEQVVDVKQEIKKRLDLMKYAKLEQMKAAKPEKKKSGKPESKAAVKVDRKDAPGAGKDPYFLVVLDMDEKTILTALRDLLHHPEHLVKVLITRSGSNIGTGDEGDGDIIQTDDRRSHEVEFMSYVDSSNLLQKRVTEEVYRATGFQRLFAAIEKSSSGHARVINMIVEAVNRVKDSELDSAVEEAASIIESADIRSLWQHGYEMLPSTLSKCCWHCRYLFAPHDSVNACDKSIHYNELITHWLLEGYFDRYDHIEMAYEEAHRTLMELKDRGFLRENENSHVYMESDALRVTDHRRDGLSGYACVGMASVLNDQTWAGLGRVIQTDGMVKTSCRKRSETSTLLIDSGNGNEISTLLIDGARFCRGLPERFFQQLKVLVILKPMFKKLPSPLPTLKELQILVLRGCHLLESVDEIKELTKLLVLEISGACLVKQIHDDLFEPMKDLRSLNLSEIGIKWLPTSVLNRRELRWLILRKCPNLKLLCDTNLLRKKEAAKQEVFSLAKLEVLDFSGSDSFENIQVRTLNSLQKLQILNLSETKIGRLPFFHNLGELTRLLLSDCSFLARLPTLRPLTKLEIVVLSRTICLKEVQDDSQETKTKFRVLDLTGSAVNKLPSNINSLSHLLLSGCIDLRKLPSTQSLKGLKELDLSDAYMLEGFEDDSFGHLISLRRLILSNTKIKALPSLPEHSELRFLSLKNCKCLTELQSLSKLQKLEVLDLSGCSGLVITSNDSFRGISHLKTIDLSDTKIESLLPDCFPISLCELKIRKCPNFKVPSLEYLSNLEVLDLHGAESVNKLEFLGHMSKLRILDLSEIKFQVLPSLSRLTDLRELHLRNCSCKVSKLDDLKKLELLDLSGTKVEPVLCLESFSNLQQLLLKDCADLEDLKDLQSLTQLGVLDLSRTKLKEYPYKTSDLTSLRKLNLEDMKHMKEIDWKQIKYIPKEFNLGGCRSLSSENSASSEWPSISMCGTRFLQFVEENSDLWDTYFQNFHFCVWLSKNEDGRIYDLGDWGLLTDIKSQGRIPHHEELGRYLEIHGSYCKSSLPESVLEHADHISLIDDSSFSHLSELVKENLKSIKSCWLERCISIKSIVDRQEDARASGKLEFLYLCNLSSLRCICDDKVQVEVFGGLKSLYVECCPMLTDIFPLSKLPKKLETLRIKFCDEMRELFDHGVSAECNLQTLDLMELPKLEKIGVMMVSLRVLKVRRCPILKNLCPLSDLPKKLRTLHIKSCDEMKELFSPGMAAECNLQTLDLMELNKLEKIGVMMVSLRVLKVGQCPYLENLEEVLGEAENLETLHISHAARLKTICNREVKPTSFKKLKQLKIESCPQLKEVSPSSELPQNLEVLEIDSCESLETIFVGSSAGSSLSRVRLRCLPKLSSSGFIVLPRYDVSSCPNLQIDRSG